MVERFLISVLWIVVVVSCTVVSVGIVAVTTILVSKDIPLNDPFLPYALSVGGGFASAKLDTEFGSDSGTAPVFHFGYDYPITKNFQISLSYTWLGVNLAVQDTQSVTPPTPTTTTIQKRAVIALTRLEGVVTNNYSAFKGSLSRISFDTRIVVTATIPTETTVQETTTTIQSTEIKNLSTIKIGFRYSF